MTRTVVLLVLLLAAGTAQAYAAGIIDSVDPKEVSQGDTVMITIKGHDLPEGSIVVEFYPQQIAVLDILSSSDTEIVAQCKVPNLAQPGMYNVLVYNQLGIEVMKENALRVRSELFTPVFTGYSPKAFVEADEGFALMLTGDLISEDALKLLTVTWSRDGKEVGGLDTTLAMAGPGTVVAAVSGNPGEGTLRGTVKMGDTPIYLVQIEIYRQGTDIFGMSPAEVNGNADWITIKLVGEGLTNMSSSSLAMFLARGKRKYAAKSVTVLNDSAAEGSFAGPVEAGQYDVTVERDGQLLYSAPLNVTWEEKPPEVEIPEEGTPATGEAGTDEVTGAPFEAETPAGPEDVPGTEEEAPGTEEEASSTGLEAPPGAPQLIEGISVSSIPAGGDPVRLDLHGAQLDPVTFDRLNCELTVGDMPAKLMLATSLGGQYSLIFSPKLGEWQAGTMADLKVSDPDGQFAPYEVSLPVTAKGSEPGFVEAAAGPQSWEVSGVSVSDSNGQSQLEIRYDGKAGQLDPSGFSGSFSLIPQAAGIEDYFSNITTSGDLTYSIDGDTLVASAVGNFVSGSLLVRMSYLDGPQEVSIAQLDSGPPRAVITSPTELKLMVNPETGAVSPEMLSWIVDFAPLAPSDPALVKMEISEAGGQPSGLSSYVDSTQVHFSLTTANLLPAGEPPSALTCQFSSDLNLAWNREPEDSVAVEVSDKPLGSLQIELAATQVELSDDGFDLSLLPAGELPSVEQWSQVKLHSGDDMLNQQIDGFMVRAVETQLFGRQGVILEFRRNTSRVNDAEYRSLVDDLTGQPQVLLTLTWDELGLEQTAWVTFSKPSDS